jgi:hypothetical protein
MGLNAYLVCGVSRGPPSPRPSPPGEGEAGDALQAFRAPLAHSFPFVADSVKRGSSLRELTRINADAVIE